MTVIKQNRRKRTDEITDSNTHHHYSKMENKKNCGDAERERMSKTKPIIVVSSCKSDNQICVLAAQMLGSSPDSTHIWMSSQ